jgi:hypothetical protein
MNFILFAIVQSRFFPLFQLVIQYIKTCFIISIHNENPTLILFIQLLGYIFFSLIFFQSIFFLILSFNIKLIFY